MLHSNDAASEENRVKALQIIEAEKTHFIDTEMPQPAPDEVLLKIMRVGYCGTDLHTFRGRNPLVQYPRIPCHELAAVIERRGSQVPEPWYVGRQVTLSPYTSCGRCSACRQERFNCCSNNQTLGAQRDGGLTEYLAVPWQKLLASPKLSLRELALVEPLSVGFHAVRRGRVEATDTVAVLGCGAIGLGVIAGAAYRGARVIAVDISDQKLEKARKTGATELINNSDGSMHERLKTLTGGEGPAVVIEAIGLPSTFQAAIAEVCYGGRVVYIGYAKEMVSYETKYFLLKEIDILGSRNASLEDFRMVIEYLEHGRFPVDEVVTRVYPFEEAGLAFEAWNRDPEHFTKIQVAFAE
jgi:threonine dehydrogenase-like Zn-dependent dehydrogenase